MELVTNSHEFPTKKLNAKQLQAAVLLAGGATVVAAAHDIGISERTIHRWRKIPCFVAEVRTIENEAYVESLLLQKKANKAAVECLIRNMGSKAPIYCQIQAAATITAANRELHENELLEARILELEAAMEEQGYSVPARRNSYYNG